MRIRLLVLLAATSACISRDVAELQPHPTGEVLKDINVSADIDHSGTLDQAFSCIAQLGSQGCGYEHQLEGMKRALDGSRPENADFLRPGAFLAVVVLTDEDDCSVRDHDLFGLPDSIAGNGDFRCQPLYAYDCDQAIVATAPGKYTGCKVRRDSYLQDPRFYSDFLIGLKGDASRVAIALIAGDPSVDIETAGTAPDLTLVPSCTTMTTRAIGRPAIRLTDFMQPFAGHGTFHSVCQADYSQALTDIGRLLFNALTPCLEGQVDETDLDPVQPGLQIDCQVSDVQNEGTPQMTEQVVPRCPMSDGTTPAAAGPRPCWWVTPNPTTCMTTTGLEIRVERASVPPPLTNVRIRCRTTL